MTLPICGVTLRDSTDLLLVNHVMWRLVAKDAVVFGEGVVHRAQYGFPKRARVSVAHTKLAGLSPSRLNEAL